MSLKNKLQRMKGHMSLENMRQFDQADETETAETTETSVQEIPFLEEWSKLNATPYGSSDEYVMVREVRYPITTRHGRYAFEQLGEVIDAWDKAGLEHPLSTAGKKATNLLFFDTETTGLHGGAGNTIFLLGYSRFEQNEVIVRQHFLAQPHAEAVLYQSFLDDVRVSKDLVTFNGKSFDWPQVKTRHTLVRHSVPELPAFGHYDLLHGARRLWKGELESCRLSLIEQAKLGIVRDHDVPGYMAPILYFDFLANQDPSIIEGVLIHNEVDVLSLISLYIHISHMLLGKGNEEVSVIESFELARWFEAVGAEAIAMDKYHRVARTDHFLRGKAKLALGLLYKKQNQWREALRLWEEAIEENHQLPDVIYIEAAKIYEHQLKDYEKALAYTLKGMELVKKKGQLLRKKANNELAEYRKRLERLEKKINHTKINDQLTF
ncbi:ribonuclease H-like domain-containing protein [Brevibacillus ginsengisoli]|uniref:ribonuclease H-like domain-containing protein n=1 Tax=Brevibacillus ginsengisoli TaxID=363854 RepID=UPI003CE829FD